VVFRQRSHYFYFHEGAETAAVVVGKISSANPRKVALILSKITVYAKSARRTGIFFSEKIIKYAP